VLGHRCTRVENPGEGVPDVFCRTVYVTTQTVFSSLSQVQVQIKNILYFENCNCVLQSRFIFISNLQN
jgi:hypothetical protein